METIKANARDMSVKAKRLRAQGIIPGSVFGGSIEGSIDLQISGEEVKHLLADNRLGSRLMLELGDRSFPVQLKDVSRDALKGTVLNISFQALRPDQRVNSLIHIALRNTEKFTAATVEQMIDEVPYSSLPADMIDLINLDVSLAKVGDVVCVADIPELKSEKLSVQLAPDEIVYRIVEKRSAAEDSEEAAE